MGGAALDVLEGEERLPSPDRAAGPADELFRQRLHRLQQLPNAILTPHGAYRTRRALYETVETTLTNCVNFERNRANEAAHHRDPVRGLLGGA